MRSKIFRYFLWLSVITILILPIASCGNTPAKVYADLGEEFSLSIGQTASINGQALQITFEDVIEDSRYPSNVTCVWAGRVSCIIRIVEDSSQYRMVLTEPGLTDQYTSVTYKEYQLTFHVRPYPVSGQSIQKSEYRLQLIVEFSLSVGQTAVIGKQALQITFEDVVEDSRCPSDVTCIWAGRVSCIIKIVQDSSEYRMVLTEPGLTDQYATVTYEEYQLAFHVTPYPEAAQPIQKGEYRLHLIVNK